MATTKKPTKAAILKDITDLKAEVDKKLKGKTKSLYEDIQLKRIKELLDEAKFYATHEDDPNFLEDKTRRNTQNEKVYNALGDKCYILANNKALGHRATSVLHDAGSILYYLPKVINKYWLK